MAKSSASTTKSYTEQDMLLLIDDLLEVATFEAENCDFGPAYGMWERRREQAFRKARSLLRSKQFKRSKS